MVTCERRGIRRGDARRGDGAFAGLDVCLRRGPRGPTALEARRPGPFRLSVNQSPGSLVERIVSGEGGVRAATHPGDPDEGALMGL